MANGRQRRAQLPYLRTPLRSQDLTIGQLASHAGVHIETVRYYQRLGLVIVPERRRGSIRRYGDESVARLEFIRRARALGFQLQEVKTLLSLDRSACAPARGLAARKLETINRKIEELLATRTILLGLIAACESGEPSRCPVFDHLTT